MESCGSIVLNFSQYYVYVNLISFFGGEVYLFGYLGDEKEKWMGWLQCQG